MSRPRDANRPDHGDLAVGIVTALKPEFNGFRRVFDPGAKDFELAGRQACKGTWGPATVWLLRAGWGKSMAASGTQALIDRARPALILDCGTAGGLGCGLQVGQAVVSTEAVDGQLPVRGADRLTVPENLVDHFVGSLRAGGASVVSGPFITLEKVVDNVDERAKLRSEGFVAVTWETFAVLKTAQVNAVAALAVRAVSDLADGSVRSDFAASSRRVCPGLASAVRSALADPLPVLAPCTHSNRVLQHDP